MNPKTIKTTAIVLVVVALVAAAATISYYVQRRRTVAQQARLLEQAREQQSVAEPAETVEVAVEGPVSTEAEADASTPEEDPEPANDEAPEPAPEKITQFAFVQKATDSGGKVTLTLDYADFLTGQAAIDAALADGEEPPPNDYYISNQNSKVRKLTVKKGALFVIVGAEPDDTEKLSASEFVDALAADLDGVADAGFWFVIQGDEVQSGEQQWAP